MELVINTEKPYVLLITTVNCPSLSSDRSNVLIRIQNLVSIMFLLSLFLHLAAINFQNLLCILLKYISLSEVAVSVDVEIWTWKFVYTNEDVIFPTLIFLLKLVDLSYELTPWHKEPGGSMPHSQGLSNNPYPDSNQPDSSHWQLFPF